jgi:cytosine/adenosine deaminase-related metal-dependent hydrolase
VKTFCGSFERGGLVGPKIVLTAKAILTGHRARPLMDGFVLIGGNRILEVGPRKDLRFLPRPVARPGGHDPLAGLINAHGHLDYTCLEGRVPLSGRFREWLTAMATATRP